MSLQDDQLPVAAKYEARHLSGKVELPAGHLVKQVASLDAVRNSSFIYGWIVLSWLLTFAIVFVVDGCKHPWRLLELFCGTLVGSIVGFGAGVVGSVINSLLSGGGLSPPALEQGNDNTTVRVSSNWHHGLVQQQKMLKVRERLLRTVFGVSVCGVAQVIYACITELQRVSYPFSWTVCAFLFALCVLPFALHVYVFRCLRKLRSSGEPIEKTSPVIARALGADSKSELSATDEAERKLRHIAEIVEVPVEYFAKRIVPKNFFEKSGMPMFPVAVVWLCFALFAAPSALWFAYTIGVCGALLLMALCAGGVLLEQNLPAIAKSENSGFINVRSEWLHRPVASQVCTKALVTLAWLCWGASLLGFAILLGSGGVYLLFDKIMACVGVGPWSGLAACVVLLVLSILPVGHVRSFLVMKRASRPMTSQQIMGVIDALEGARQTGTNSSS